MDHAVVYTEIIIYNKVIFFTVFTINKLQLIIYLAHLLNVNFHLTHHHLAGLEGVKATMSGKETPMTAT